MLLKKRLGAALLSLCLILGLHVPAYAGEAEDTLQTGETDLSETRAFPEASELPEVFEAPEPEVLSAAEAFEEASGSLTFDFSDAGVLTINGTGPPDLSGWKGNGNDVRSVIIRSGITSIPENAFRDFPLLASADIAGTVQSIGSNAFYECEKLERITIRPGVQSIGSCAFYRCLALTDIYLPSSIRSLGASAFYSCGSMTSVNIPDGVEDLPDRVFAGCNRLTSIHIPDSVKSVGASAFDGCSALEEVRLPEGLANIAATTFRSCKALSSICFPTGLTFIGNNAFQESGLTSVTVPGGLSVGDGVFQDCLRLKTAELAGPPASLGMSLFYRCLALTSVSLPEGLTSIPDYAFYLCESLDSVHIPDSVTHVGGGAFEGCRKLAELRLPAGLTSISNKAFSSCGLISLSLPEGLASIGDEAFRACSGLRELDLPESLTALGNGAFWGCLRLTWASLPTGIGKSVPENLFSGCSSLTAVFIPGTVQQVLPNAFENCGSLRTVLFGGSEEAWTYYVTIDPQNNDALENANVYFQGQFPTLYTVTVSGSEATVTGAGRYPAGTQVSLAVRNPYMGTEQTFDHWELEDVSLPDPSVENVSFTMPAGDVSAVVIWRESLFAVQVSGSYAEHSGEGNYPAGAAVTLHAGERPGYCFTAWTVSGVTLGDRFDPDPSFTMPANRVTAEANWQMLGYSLFVRGSYASNSGQGTFPLGRAVTLRAGTRPGYVFDGWAVEGAALSPDQLAAPELTFLMPANDVTATVRWRASASIQSQDGDRTVAAVSLDFLESLTASGKAPQVLAAPETGGALSGQVNVSTGEITFQGSLTSGRLFFLEPETYIPLARPAVLK